MSLQQERAFRDANVAPVPCLETNSVINLCANVRLMGLTGIIPEYFLEVLGRSPTSAHVGLIAVDRDPASPLVLASFDCARTIEPRALARADGLT